MKRGEAITIANVVRQKYGERSFDFLDRQIQIADNKKERSRWIAVRLLIGLDDVRLPTHLGDRFDLPWSN